MIDLEISHVILVCCGGGGGVHNNLLGENSYIAKYIGKGIGKLCKILPLMYEVLHLPSESAS